MKEKFTKLFGALMLVALLLGLVLPFQFAAAQEEIPLTVIPTITADDGFAIGAPVTVTVGIVSNAVDVPTYYVIARSETESGAKIMLADPLPAAAVPLVFTTVYVDTTAIPGRMYWYWVKACDALSCSAFFSDTGWRAVDGSAGAPVATTGLPAEPFDKVVVTITPPAAGLPAVDGYYQVWRQQQTPSVGTWAKVGTTTTVTFNDTTASGQLMDGTLAKTYNYKVDVCGKDKCAFDNAVSFVMPVTAAPGQRQFPAGLAPLPTANSGVKKVTLIWNGSAIPQVTTYYGQRSYGAQTLPVIPVKLDAASTPENPANIYMVDDNTAQPGITYTYKLWACVTPGSENCTLVNTVVGAAQAGAVADLKASDGDYKTPLGELVTGAIKVTWTASSDAAILGYRLYRSDDAAGTVNVNITDVAGPTPNAPMAFEDVTTDWGKTYYYWIKGCTAGFATCGTSSAVDSGWAAIPKVTGFTTTNAKTGVSGTWTAITGSGIFYRGWRANTAVFAGAAGPVAILPTSGTDPTGAAGVNYWYFIQACYTADTVRCGLPSDPTAGMKLLP